MVVVDHEAREAGRRHARDGVDAGAKGQGADDVALEAEADGIKEEHGGESAARAGCGRMVGYGWRRGDEGKKGAV